MKFIKLRDAKNRPFRLIFPFHGTIGFDPSCPRAMVPTIMGSFLDDESENFILTMPEGSTVAKHFKELGPDAEGFNFEIAKNDNDDDLKVFSLSSSSPSFTKISR